MITDIKDIELLQGEIFKDVKGFENLYKVSNYGRVYSNNINKLLQLDKSQGYVRVELWKKGVRHKHNVSRIVAEAFVEKPTEYTENKLEVHHINGNKKDNRASNLAWVSKNIHTDIHNYLREQDRAED